MNNIPEQHVSVPSYKIKKEKREKTATPTKEPTSTDIFSPTLMDLALVGVVDDQGTAKSLGLSAPAKKWKKVEKERVYTSQVGQTNQQSLHQIADWPRFQPTL